MHTNVHGGMIYNRQKVETTHVPVSGEKEKQKVVCPSRGVLFSREKTRCRDTGHGVDAPYRREQRKPVAKGPVVRFHLWEVSRKGEAIARDRKRVAGARGWGDDSVGSDRRRVQGPRSGRGERSGVGGGGHTPPSVLSTAESYV